MQKIITPPVDPNNRKYIVVVEDEEYPRPAQNQVYQITLGSIFSDKCQDLGLPDFSTLKLHDVLVLSKDKSSYANAVTLAKNEVANYASTLSQVAQALSCTSFTYKHHEKDDFSKSTKGNAKAGLKGGSVSVHFEQKLRQVAEALTEVMYKGAANGIPDPIRANEILLASDFADDSAATALISMVNAGSGSLPQEFKWKSSRIETVVREYEAAINAAYLLFKSEGDVQRLSSMVSELNLEVTFKFD